MDGNKFSKKRIIGYIALWIFVAILSYMEIYSFVSGCQMLSDDFGYASVQQSIIWSLVSLIISIVVWMAGISSLIVHCVKFVRGNNAKLIANSLIGIVAIICALAGMFLLNIVLGDNIEFYFGAEYNVACFVLFFLSAIISVGLLYLSIFWKGEHDKKYKLYILIGIAIVVAIALMIFVPNLIATIKRGG